MPPTVEIPSGYIAQIRSLADPDQRRYLAELRDQIDAVFARWHLTQTGAPMFGACALVIPVRTAGLGDGPRDAVVKFQLIDDESAGEASALRRWNGDGAALLLDEDAATGALLLERLGETLADQVRAGIVDPLVATETIGRLLARLTRPTAPTGIRLLSDIADRMLVDLPPALAQLAPAAGAVFSACGTALAEVLDEPGGRLLHWDLHFGNVLAAAREPWLAIDPKPLAGDPGFELLPALLNLYDPAHVRYRFDALTEIIGLDRHRAAAWTLARVLQNGLWEVDDGEPPAADNLAVAQLLLDTYRP